jgi:ketosteroid isomerase-like protein
MSIENDVKAAAANVVAAFGSHNRAEYFSSFAQSATFMFHNAQVLLANRAEYEAEWTAWESEGFKVLGCQSTMGRVDILSDVTAVFTHTVRTQLADGDGQIETGERETIVFQLIDGKWLGIHEHLSVDPNYQT